MAQSTSRNHPLGHPSDEPREAADTPLAGRVALLPRVKEPDRIASALERAGAEVQRAAVTRTVPGEAAALEATARRIAAGEAAWLVLTSARTVEALAPYLPAEAGIGPAAGSHGHHNDSGASHARSDALPHRARATSPGQRPGAAILPVRVAVVGPATARAWTELTGAAPDLVARGSATALLEEPALAGGPASEDHAPHQEPDASSTHHGTPSPHTPARSPESKTGPRGFPGNATGPHDFDGSAHALHGSPACPQGAPEAAGRVLLPASALADPTLADSLRRAGWEVEQVAAYSTVTADTSDLPTDLPRVWADGGVDAVVLTAPSTTRAVLELLGSPPAATRLVAIGATTASAAHELGLPVAATASSPTPEGVLRAVIAAMTPDPAMFTTAPLRSTS